ncbi:hypothetical protein HUN01_01450 (plasmid) [Nostoc edaphicum CCNP1411]|uniref:Uncharacterized protein n=1 Tax=Nostoc edaphicum CCNP1411 TaxID=1472755 RepID=A0A7D7LBE4_9NOSO|nr:hypothetical protein [Nostoc edaphicum]QMS86312.1 hypothetical protein HUN01_01450 [Nostoc edaphicum CCNP1411]
MSLPKEFQSVIEEEYGRFGWEVANCFKFTSEFLGYKVLNISSVEAALKSIATDMGSSLANYSYPNDLPSFIKKQYPKIHLVFTKQAKYIKLPNEDDEYDRQEKVAEKFAEYTILKTTESVTNITNNFYKVFVVDTLYLVIHDFLSEVEEAIIERQQQYL